MFERMMMTDVGLDLRAFDVFGRKRGRLVGAVRALLSKRQRQPHAAQCVCAPCQAR